MFSELHVQEAASNKSNWRMKDWPAFASLICLRVKLKCPEAGRFRISYRDPCDQTLRAMAHMINFGVEENIAEQNSKFASKFIQI